MGGHHEKHDRVPSSVCHGTAIITSASLKLLMCLSPSLNSDFLETGCVNYDGFPEPSTIRCTRGNEEVFLPEHMNVQGKDQSFLSSLVVFLSCKLLL